MQSPPQSFNNNFHLLRHIAAFLVLYAHAVTALGHPEIIYEMSGGKIELSSLGVYIFFIVSGYLVMQSRLQTNGRIAFALKRWLRIWPAMFIITVVLAFIAGPLLTVLPLGQYFSSPQTWQFFVRNSLFLPVYRLPGVFNGLGINSPFWTLFFEVVCYACLFVANKQFLLKHKRLLMVLFGLVASIRYWQGANIAWNGFPANYQYGIRDMMFLFMAAAIYQLNSVENSKFSKMLVPLGLFLCCIAIIIPFSAGIDELLRDAGLIVFVIEFGKAKAVIKWPSWDISYGMYLIAYPVQMTVAFYLPVFKETDTGIFCATLLISLPLAFASWYGVEKPALSKKNTAKKE